MSDFDLRTLIREVCDTTDLADPGALADEVHGRIKVKDRDAALTQCLRTLVVQVIGQQRMNHSDSPGGQLPDGTHHPFAAGGSPSRKVAAIRNAWRSMLRDRIPVSDTRGDWKFLRDCTAVDLDYAARLREENARRNEASAKHYRALIAQLSLHEVATVGELPEDALGFGDDQ